MKSYCQICGEKCNENNKIIDSRFNAPLQNNAIVCNRCFDLWLSHDEQELLKRIKMKLLVKQT